MEIEKDDVERKDGEALRKAIWTAFGLLSGFLKYINVCREVLV